MGIERFLRISFEDTQGDQRALFVAKNSTYGLTEEKFSHAAEAKKEFSLIMQEVNGIDPKRIEAQTGIPAESFMGPEPASYYPSLAGQQFGDRLLFEQLDTKTVDDKVIDTLLFFVALFRTATTNNVENPVRGPPILRLTFGTMYQSVPCICKSYNLSWEEEAGYDLHTLTPRRLAINLELEELRSGNFGTYSPNDFIARNNLTGWESAIAAPFTTDPTSRSYGGG